MLPAGNALPNADPDGPLYMSNGSSEYASPPSDGQVRLINYALCSLETQLRSLGAMLVSVSAAAFGMRALRSRVHADKQTAQSGAVIIRPIP